MDKKSAYYDNDYFNWQKPPGEFGGWANQTKFIDYTKQNDTVLDFGCGGGFLLDRLNIKKEFGVEINPSAMKSAKEKGIEVYNDVDVIISNNALEHTLRPLDELKSLYKRLKKGGKIIFVVPCESKAYIHKCPPRYLEIAKKGRDTFEEACKKYGQKEPSWFQVRDVGTK